MTHIRFAVFVAAWNAVQGLTTPSLHIQMANWLEDRWHANDAVWLLMAFRNSGKSTLVGLFAAWLLMRNADLRILVLAADHQLAVKMVRNVRRVLERHPLTSGLRPQKTEEWAADRFTVTRAATHRDPSMLAKGITSNVTGSRADIVICDDVEVPNTCDTALKRAELRTRLDEIDFVLSPDGVRLFVGTPHTYHSLYITDDIGSSDQAPYLRGAVRLTLPIYDVSGQSRWPERFSHSQINVIRERTGPAKFSSQMLLHPTDTTEVRLDPTRLISYSDDLDFAEGNGQPVLSIGDVRMVSASCFWDPSFGRPGRSDGAVIAAVFTDADGRHWLHGIDYLSFDPALAEDIDEATQLCRQAARFAARHFLPSVTVESNGIGKFLPGLLRREVRRAGLACAVIDHVSHRNKTARILEAFDAVLAARRLHVSCSVMEGPFAEEMRDWRPNANGPDDGLDAVAGCLLAEPVRIAGAPTDRHPRARNMTSWQSGGGPVKIAADFEV